MSDPVAEAAAQLAAQQNPEPTGLVGELKQVIHKAEDAIEHLIHPDAAGNESAGATESATAPAIAESPNAADTPPNGAATPAAGDVPNAASAAGEPTAEQAFAPSADGANTESQTGANSAEPLHVSIARHLEAIYTLARDHIAAPAVADTSALKTHVGDILHRISNGMQVTEGELVSKLEALYRML